MNPLAAFYGAITDVRNSFYDRGVFKAHGLKYPVISIGNLSIGGSGKTPFVIKLGELLLEHGLAIDVLSRGYRRKTKGVLQVDPGGIASMFGDEPLLIARRLKCPVVVGALRYDAGRWAEHHIKTGDKPRIHLLDDGFQHRQLARNFDIVLLTQEDIGDSLIPGGRLREELAALARADAIVAMDGASLDGLSLQGKHLWQATRRLELPSVSGPVIAFAGVARPQRFFDELRRSGVDVKHEIIFRDHYRYHASDVRNLLRLRERKNAVSFITTEKDAVNLGAHLQALEPIVVPMTIEISSPENVVETLMSVVAERSGMRKSTGTSRA
jgi:tetraacyldisaccharide 4'-kinase